MGSQSTLPSAEQIIASGAKVINTEAKALNIGAKRLGKEFADAVALLFSTKSKVVVSGLGKSGHVAAKIAATLASTGTASFCLHPSEALHGDLGMLSQGDSLVAIAYGGETYETLEVAKYARRIGVKVIAITGKKDSSLARLSDVVLDGSVDEEACPLNLAPTSSSSLALALGDAMAIALMEARGFSEQSFASFHPGGSLGKRLMLVSDAMRKRDELNVVSPETDFFQVMEKISKPNFGIIAVLDAKSKLIGAITDGDIRRALSQQGGAALKMSAGELMSKNPKTVAKSLLAIDAFRLMEQNKITSLFVEESLGDRHLAGIIRMHDLLEQKIV